MFHTHPLEVLKRIDVSAQWKEPDASIVSFYDLAKHIERIRSADYEYPIVMHNGAILDGFHRLVRALCDKKTTIHAYQLYDDDMDWFLNRYGKKV